MKFVIHQTTLHLSFKIQCCVDRLRPPEKSGKHMLLVRSSQVDPLRTSVVRAPSWGLTLSPTPFRCDNRVGAIPCPEPGVDMRRREFISLVGGATVVRSLAARAQLAMPVIGFLGSSSPDNSLHLVAAFRQGLKEAGFIEGQNTLIEYRWAEGHYDRLLALATDLVRHEVTVIVTLGGAPAAQAAKSATLTIPIVFVTGGDPVQLGLVASLNRPGGNLTGVSALSNTLAAKQLELLHELLPAAPLVAFLVNPNNPLTEPDANDLRAAAHSGGQQTLLLHAGPASDIGKAVPSLVQQHAGALIVQADPVFNSQPERLATLAAGHAVPTIYQFREFAVAGCGPDCCV